MFSKTNITFLFTNKTSHDPHMGELMLSHPDQFMALISKNPDYLSPVFAKYLDEIDPLKHTAELFNIDNLYPFAGHSLGPLFQPVVDKISEAVNIQKKLHSGHFSNSHPEGAVSGHWFDCDRYEPALHGAQQLLGFKDMSEFVFTANGLSDNLAKLLDTFFRPGKKDWETGKTKIAMLGTDFFSDQAVVFSVIQRAISIAENFEMFDSVSIPEPENQIIKIQPDENGIYHTNDIILTIKNNADTIKVICLSDIVFNTGQRLELDKILTELKEVINHHNIIVGLDLAHTVGNRKINLSGFPVKIDFAVGCGYKHLCGFAGSSFGIYVNKDINLGKFPPLQGWKAADSNHVFETIHHYNASLMAKSGAIAFRTSNPPPVALIPAQTYLAYFGKIGFDKCFHKSECLTRYLIAQLQFHLSDKIDFLTPLDPAQRGAMIVFRVKGLQNVLEVEEELKKNQTSHYGYEIDVRPPNNIRLTAHYAYTKFEQIASMANQLKLVIENQLQKGYSTWILNK